MNVWDAQASRDLGEALRDAIHARAFVRGLDSADQPFAPYSPAYVRQLAAAGEPTRVDLRRSGRLEAAVLGSLQVTEAGAALRIGGDEARVAGAVNAQRPFWGVSPSDRAALVDAVRAATLDAMGRAR